MRERLLKPRFFSDEDLAEYGPWHRLLFQGLWALADREGRVEDRPAWIRTQVFPYDNLETLGVSMNAMLDDLAAPRKHSPEGGGFIVRYEVDGRRYIEVRNFKRHQRPHPKERPSDIPAPQAVMEMPRNYTDEPRKNMASREKVYTSHSGPSVPSGPSEPSGPSGTDGPDGASPPTPATPAEARVVAQRVLGKPEKAGAPGEAEALRLEIGALLDAEVKASGRPRDELQVEYSDTGRGAIVNLAGVSSVPWLTVMRDKLRAQKLRRQASERPPARASPALSPDDQALLGRAGELGVEFLAWFEVSGQAGELEGQAFVRWLAMKGIRYDGPVAVAIRMERRNQQPKRAGGRS